MYQGVRYSESPLYVFSFSLIPQVCNCDAVLWFWATYESAQYCLLARLRTPLGMPAETFTAIESKAAAELCIIIIYTCMLLSLFPVLYMYIFAKLVCKRSNIYPKIPSYINLSFFVSLQMFFVATPRRWSLVMVVISGTHPPRSPATWGRGLALVTTRST